MALKNIPVVSLTRNRYGKKQRKIVGSMFPENLVFVGYPHRTKRLNEIINIISLTDKELKPKKMGQAV